jgi:hypothetical protein
VANGRRADFELAFGTGGIWPRILFEANGYVGTELWCEIAADRQYRVRDLWAWHRDFEIFRSHHQMEYERFESWIISSGLIEKEQFLGVYYEPLGDEDEGLVLS